MKPKALVIVGHGINCDYELAEAFTQAGAQADRVHLGDLLGRRAALRDYHIIGLPGGFSFGDDCGAGNIFSKMIACDNHLMRGFLEHLVKGRLVFGTCNGNQIGSSMNLVPVNGKPFSEPEAAYSFNNSARYEDRGNIHLRVENGGSAWLRGMEGRVLRNIAIGHGEGKFHTDAQTREMFYERGRVALKYVHEDGSPANGVYPVNPNGSIDDIAGLASSQVLLMMPHPERAITPYNQDGWTRRRSQLKRKGLSLPEQGDGMEIIKNGVQYCEEKLL
jgi:phosphoribosylformylglycinamidine synthase